MFQRLVDRLILQPSTNPIDPEHRRRVGIPLGTGEIEAWVTGSDPTYNSHLVIHSHTTPAAGANTRSGIDRIAIKFPGTGGRAERSGPHPFEIDVDRKTEIWTVNPPGYGGSSGSATITSIAATGDAVWEHLTTHYPGVPIAVVGNSLGCAAALYLAAGKDVAGIYLRNPVPLQQMISSRWKYNWWNFGLARVLARWIPDELDTIENAKRCSCPLLLIRSERDRVSPERYQQLIFGAFRGEKSEFVIEGADHHDQVSDRQRDEYVISIKNWLAKINRR